jgi:hypothetical protein
LLGYRQLAMTHAHRDEIAVEASQTTPIAYGIYPSDDKKDFCDESNNFRNMKLIISQICLCFPHLAMFRLENVHMFLLPSSARLVFPTQSNLFKMFLMRRDHARYFHDFDSGFLQASIMASFRCYICKTVGDSSHQTYKKDRLFI